MAPEVKTAVILYYTYCSAAGISDGVNKVLYEHMFKCESFNLKHFRWSVRIFPLKHERCGCQACTGITGRPSPAISMEFPQNPGAELAKCRRPQKLIPAEFYTGNCCSHTSLD